MKTLLTACLLTTALCGASSAATILSDGFESFPLSSGWSNTGVDQNTTHVHTGSGSARFNSTSDELITPVLTNAQTLTFWTYTTSDSPTFNVKTSTSASGPWVDATGSPFSNTKDSWAKRNITLSSTGTLYIRFTKSGSGYVYIDDISVNDELAGNSAPVLATIGDQSVIISNELTFAVSATDANGDDIVLSATGLPSGASFSTVTNAAAVTNTFTWTDASPTGTYAVTFFAADAETNDSETITITVSEPPILPDSVTFDFRTDANLYGALDNQTGPITYTNNGLVATFATVAGEMNRTTSGFGINSDISGDDTDGFDTNEWIDITFEIPVVLTNVAVGNWNDGIDQAVIYVNSVSNGVITTDGDTPLNLLIPSGQALRLAAMNTIFNNGWSLETITVKTDTNPPPVQVADPLLIAEIADPAGTGVAGYLARFVELYNAGTNTIDLTDWTLSRQNNGGTWTDLALSGTLAPSEAYVVARSTNFALAYGFEPDATSTVADGNGFDAYALYFNGNHTSGTLIDIYGVIDTNGENTVWDYEDSRVRRNADVSEPNTTWTASEWTITPNSTTNMFSPGTHGAAPEFIPALTDQNVTLGDDVSLTVTVTNGVNTNDVITLSAIVLPEGATFPTTEGTGTVSSALSWSPTNSGTYKVTFLAKGEVDLDSESIYVYVTSAESPVISLAIPTGGPLTLAWPTSAGSAFNVLTNSNLIDTNGWGNANLIPFLDGDSYKVTNAIGSETILFYKLESQ